RTRGGGAGRRAGSRSGRRRASRGRRSARSASGSRCRTSAPRARSARSPSESTGSYVGSCTLLATGGPEFRIGRGLFLLRGPELLAGGGEVGRDALHLGGDAVERVPQAQVVPKLLEAAARSGRLQRLPHVLALQLALLAAALLD